tara:strand:+ start:52 stop:447 length:396 start_codon:yes stop_codon:yes gene_type:complete
MKSLIRNSNQTKQGIDFTGIEYGKIHPTDIDAVLEFDNKALILIEVKKKGSEILTGQRLVLERIADSWHTKKAVVLYVTHCFENENIDIPLAECTVDKIYLKKEWKPAQRQISLKDTLKGFGKYWGIKKLN